MASPDSDGDGDDYIFNRDNRSTIRLNYQHFWISQLCGYLIHPTIPTSTPNIRIADIGTGTGIWPVEASRTLPTTARIDAFDISSAQYPIPEWLPPNVHLHTHNAFAPFDRLHLGQYDIVHLRFVITLVGRESVDRLLQNLTPLLKPGGYLQWLDIDPLSARAITVRAATPHAATERLVNLMLNPRPGATYDWLPNLHSILLSHGFDEVAHDRVLMRDEYRALWNQSNIMACQEFGAKKGVQVRNDREEEERKRLKKELKRLEEEFSLGASVQIEFFCVQARKGGEESDGR